MKVKYINIPELEERIANDVWRELVPNEQFQAIADYLKMSPDELIVKMEEEEKVVEVG